MAKIGKYEIIEELGRGGMGVVYKAYDALMEREVAIKVISDGVLALPEIKSRFYREARTAGKLSHDNITVIYDVGEDEGRPFIVMEYLAGADLGTVLDQREPLPLQNKLEYAIQICRGLAFSHSRGIIHRDIKPGNIRITGDGKVKIMDFGIAKPESSNLTRTGALIGTPFYMSPEQIQGKKVDTRSDIFSFGVLFFELLTGKKPFPGSEPTSVMYKIVHEEPEPIDEHLIDRRTGLRDIVLKTLEKDPDRRYQDLSEVADALGHILADMKSADRKKVLELKQKIDRLIAESRALLSAGKFKKALETAERAAKSDPANTEIGRLSIEIRKAEEEAARKAFVESRLQDARRGYAAKKYENVIAITKQILERDPNNTEAQRLNRQAQDAITYAKTGQEQYAETIMAGPVAGKRREEPSAPQRKPTPPPQPVEPAKKTAPSPARRRTLVIAGVVLLLAGLGLSYRLFLYAPPVPTGFVMLNVRPWAQVTRVVGPGGTDVPVGTNTMTPCRLTLPAGSYTIHLANAAFGKPIVVTVDVKDAQVQEVKEKFAGFDIEQALARFQ